jgi:predicted nucleotidyltransferase component of viral defense system
VRGPQNFSASVRARLTNRAKARDEDVQLVLLRYAIERLLYRLSRSEYADRFVLKGAMLFSLWADVPYRATRDLDLLGYGDSAAEGLMEIFKAICGVGVEPDGVEFLAETIRTEQARENDEYQVVRVILEARIAEARLRLQIDIGFGDVVVPQVQEIEYPGLLDLPTPRLRAYPRETVVAEKFQAMVHFAALTSRMKDFYDLWALATMFGFEGPVLAEAIRATFERRRTSLPAAIPGSLSSEFAESRTNQSRWRGFLGRTAIAMAPEPFPAVLAKIEEFVMPPTRSVAKGDSFASAWPPGGPWRSDDRGVSASADALRS